MPTRGIELLNSKGEDLIDWDLVAICSAGGSCFPIVNRRSDKANPTFDTIISLTVTAPRRSFIDLSPIDLPLQLYAQPSRDIIWLRYRVSWIALRFWYHLCTSRSTLRISLCYYFQLAAIRLFDPTNKQAVAGQTTDHFALNSLQQRISDIMADDPQRLDSEPANTQPAKEDAQTTAARRELKQTTISDGGNKAEQPSQDSSEPSEDEAERTKTPESKTKESPQDDLRELVSSPKKKRAHDQLDEHRDDVEQSSAANASTDKATGSATVGIADRSEPQKKRARDENGGDEVRGLFLSVRLLTP